MSLGAFGHAISEVLHTARKMTRLVRGVDMLMGLEKVIPLT